MNSNKFICTLLLVIVSLFVEVVHGQIRTNDDIHYPPGDRASLKLNLQLESFDPKDLGLAIEFLDKLCSSLKYLAFRTYVEPKKYLTIPSSCQGTLKFENPSSGNGQLGNNQLFQGIQFDDKSYLLQSRSCPFHFLRVEPGGNVVIQSGPYLSSKFYLQSHNNHMHVKSQFINKYWMGEDPLKWDSGARNYIMEFWPQLLWP